VDWVALLNFFIQKEVRFVQAKKAFRRFVWSFLFKDNYFFQWVVTLLIDVLEYDVMITFLQTREVSLKLCIKKEEGKSL